MKPHPPKRNPKPKEVTGKYNEPEQVICTTTYMLNLCELAYPKDLVYTLTGYDPTGIPIYTGKFKDKD